MADVVIYDVVPRAGVIDLGKQVEGLVTRVVLPNIRRGAGAVQLVHQRSDDQEPYPVPVTEDGDKVYWIVTRSDTAFPGRGQAELQWLGENGAVAKSVTYQTNTTRSMAEPGSVPDEPLKPYTQAVAKDAQAAKNAAASATEAARSAEASAGQAGLSAENAANALKKLEEGIASGDFRGQDGKSAYQLAVDAGFDGTETQWLESLKGAPGDTTAADAAAEEAKKAAKEAQKAAEDCTGKVNELKEDIDDLVLKTKRNPLQLFDINKVTVGRLKNDGTVDINNTNYVTNRYEDISDFVGCYFASIGNDTPCAFYDEGYKLVQYFADSRYYRNQIVPANSKYFKVSTPKSAANTFCFSASNNKFNTVPTYNDYIVEETELNPIVLVPTKQDKNVGADNKGKILMVDDDGNIVYKDYWGKESKIIEYWGDSLTEGNQDHSGVTRSTVLSSLVGSAWTVINNNDGGGEKSNTISCKACGTGIIAEPFTIPSSTDKVEVVLKDDIGYDCNFRKSSNMAESTLNPCIINGITGIISQGPVYGQNPYKFQRNESGNEVVLKRPTGVISSSAKKQKGSVLIICIGQNTGWNNDGSLLVKQVKGIIDYYKSTRFLVIGIPHSKVHDWQIAGNDALKLEFGRHYIDVEEYMKTPIYDADGTTIISSYALDDCNLTPTSEDIVNIGQNKYPTQIMSDSTHFNRYGYTIWANLEYQRGKELGYWN